MSDDDFGETSGSFRASRYEPRRTLSRAEVTAYISDSLFEAADASKDGNLTVEEWTAGGGVARPNRFRAADANSDGMVTRAEAHRYAGTQPIIQEFMSGADTNKDGALSREEAVAYYGSREGPPR